MSGLNNLQQTASGVGKGVGQGASQGASQGAQGVSRGAQGVSQGASQGASQTAQRASQAPQGVSQGTQGVSSGVNQATQNVQKTTQQATKPVTKTVSDTAGNLPGSFPKDEPPTNQKNNVSVPSFSELWNQFLAWMKGLVPRGVDIFEAAVRRFINWLLPAEQQAKMFKAAQEHPIVATFVTAQLICVGIPLLLFLAGTFLFAAVAGLVWVVLSLLILGPIVLIASFMGIGLWGWGWFVFGLVRWIDKLVLGGMLERFWKAQIAQQKAQQEAEKLGEGGSQKETDEEKRDD